MFDWTAEDLRAALAADPRTAAVVRLEWHPEIDSTNERALALAARGAAAGTTVIAGQQHAGRGRLGRGWFSPPGAGLYVSTIVRPAPPTPLITLGAGVALARATAHATGLPVELKWPNDLVIGRPWRKIAGILCETSGTGSRVDAVVVGIGVNLAPAAYPPEVADRASSLEAELGRPADGVRLAVEVLAEVQAMVRHLDASDRAWVLDEWRRFAAAGLRQAAVCWQDRGEVRRGWARDVDDDGALVVERDGQRERIVAGDVTWERVT